MPSATALERGIVLATASLVPIALALRDGSYELIERQQFGLVLWWAIAICMAFGWLPRGRPGPGFRLALVGLLALLTWTAVSVLWTGSDERTTAEVARVVSYAGVLVLAWYGVHPGTARAAATGVAIAALGVPVLAVAGRLLPDLAPWGALGAFFETRRLLYPLGYWNAVAAWASMAVAIGLALSLQLRDGFARGACLAAVPVAGLAVYLTYSRTGLAACALVAVMAVVLSHDRPVAFLHTFVATLATGIAIALAAGHDQIANGSGGAGGGIVLAVLLIGVAGCAAIASSTRRRKRREPATAPPAPARRWAIGPALVALVVVAVIAPPIAGQAVEQLGSDSYPKRSGDPSARLTSFEGSRDEIWSSALAAFESEPIRGIGPGTFEFWWSREGEPESVADAHSFFIESLAELGIVGLASALLLFGGLAAMAVRAAAKPHRYGVGLSYGLLPAFAVFLMFAAVDWAWESTALTVLGLGAGAIAAADRSAKVRRATGVVRRFALVALAVGAAATQVPGLVSAQRIRASDAELAVGETRRAAELAQDAIDAQPWAAGPHAQQALVALEARHFARAKREADAAIDREPDNWRHWLLKARAELDAGDEVGAGDAAAMALELRPSPPEELESILEELRPSPSPG